MKTILFAIALLIFQFLKITDENYTDEIKLINLNCVDFKTGTFIANACNYNMPTTTIIRSEKTQKEEATGFETLEASIEWITDCNFKLTYPNSSKDIKGVEIGVEILKIEGQKAICSGTITSEPGIFLNFELEKQK